jgi:hypothetical protein
MCDGDGGGRDDFGGDCNGGDGGGCVVVVVAIELVQYLPHLGSDLPTLCVLIHLILTRIL